MNTGVELLLARMETHPEEFVGVNGGCSREWFTVVNPVVPYLTQEEKDAINIALEKAHREHFTGQVMKVISGESVLTVRQRQTIDEDYSYGHSLADRLNAGRPGAKLGAQLGNAAIPLSPTTLTVSGSS